MKDYKEAIEYYEDKLNQLNRESDAEKHIIINDRLALVYFEI